MKKFIKIPILILLCVTLIIGGVVAIQAGDEKGTETNAFTSDYYIGATNQDKPFFDVILPEIAANIEENNKKSITPYYDALPLANNPENFQGLGSTTYANINGQTVTAEAFLRLYGDSLHDPNAGMGLMIYQCIQYKLAHPKENVKISFSTYRTSVAAAVCVLPESRYYGYMRSLYGTNYDEHGFVRISFMLAEAARMGIDVVQVNHHNSYAVSQYNPSTKSVKNRAVLKFKTYFNQAMKTDCYNKYAPGKKVSDFMTFSVVEWTMDDKGSDAQHMKHCTVSHYLATDGTEHKNAVFFTSANLDENDYKGRNGNGLAQSGAIISDHEGLYRATYNYNKLMSQYDGKEELYVFQKIVNERNVKQAEMLRTGKGSRIPRDEQIVYVGGKNDPVFELYFTPFGGGLDVWDTVNNPYCKYVDKLAMSEDYSELAFNIYEFAPDGHIASTVEKMIEQAFCDNPNPKNKIFLRVPNFDSTAIRKLKVGTQIGKRDIETKDSGTNNRYHTKDMLLSYMENGERHRVTLMGSCNFYPTAFSLRTNSLLVINETDVSGGSFYGIYGPRFTNGMFGGDLLVAPGDLSMTAGTQEQLDVHYSGSKSLKWTSSNSSVATVTNGTVEALKNGCAVITVSDGKTASAVKVTVEGECAKCMTADSGLNNTINEHYTLSKSIDDVPLTFETEFTLNKKDLVITNAMLGSDDSYSGGWAFCITRTGYPFVIIRDKAGLNTTKSYFFNQVYVATGQKLHMAIVIDPQKGKMHCYINGELAQTISGIKNATDFGTKFNPVVGGAYKNGNETYFSGTIHSMSVWSDKRTATEIASDYKKGITVSDSNLLAAYDFTQCDSCMLKDKSANKNNIDKVDLWLEKSEVAPVEDYAYSFAVVGDTQIMSKKDPDAMESIYDWIIKNKDAHKIKYVMGLGDITNDSTNKEWENADKFIGKLNGVLPYSLCRGNDDDWDDFNRYLHNGFYENTVDGLMKSDDISLSDPDQPGVWVGQRPDGSTGPVTVTGGIPEGGTVKGDLTNSYRTIEIGGNKYLIMTIDFAADSETLQWANDVIQSHPDYQVIVTTHAYLYRDGTTVDEGDLYPATDPYFKGYNDPQNGDKMWENVFSRHENVLMVISGHDPWQHIVCQQEKGVNGNTVTQMLIDAQDVDAAIGSNAMVAILYFSEDGETMTVRYYSVEKDCYGSELSQFTVRLH